MVEQEFALTVGVVDGTIHALRAFDPAAHTAEQMEDLAGRFEDLRRTLTTATARNRAELHRRLAPPPQTGDPSDDDGAPSDGGRGSTHGADGARSGSPPGPRPGDPGDRTGSDHDESARQSRTARVAAALPTAMVAFEAGDITEAHVRALCVAVDCDEGRARDDEERLVLWARRHGPRRFRTMIANWCRYGQDPAERDAEQIRKRAVHVDTGHRDGMIRINAVMRTADGRNFAACLDALAEDIYRDAHPDRPESTDEIRSTLAQRRHDALAVMADRAAAAPRQPSRGRGTPGTHRRRPTITVVTDVDGLRARIRLHDVLGPRSARTPHGDMITPSELRRLACDADILPVVMGGEGQVLDVGRSRRTVPPHLWDALVARDGACTRPGCDAPPEWCHAHHVIHWADGGPTAPWNLTLVCTRHHNDIHDDLATVSGQAPDLTWEFRQPATDPPAGGGPPTARGPTPPSALADENTLFVA